jgi:uncharacterized membrane protein
MTTQRPSYGEFPQAAVFLLGLGLGGFFDGIVFHQLLQWHHMVSSWYPPTSLENLRLNTRWDGLFHCATCLLVVLGIALFWRKASVRELYWSTEMLIGGLLVGWGSFNLVEGLVDHSLLGLHHVNETVPAVERPFWDLAFLAWGALMLAGGRALQRQADRRRRAPGARPARPSNARA